MRRNMRPETEARYRAATEKKYGRPFTDQEWDECIERYLKKRTARYAVAKNLDRGILTAYTCAFCESNDSEAHHPDYDLPLAVVWICRSHHRKEHVALKEMNRFDRLHRRNVMVECARDYNGKVADWTIEEALRGIPNRTEEEEWGSIDDFQETIIEYDREEVERSNATSEGLPTDVHPPGGFAAYGKRLPPLPRNREDRMIEKPYQRPGQPDGSVPWESAACFGIAAAIVILVISMGISANDQRMKAMDARIKALEAQLAAKP